MRVNYIIIALILFGCSSSQMILVEGINQKASNNIIFLLGTNNINANKIIAKDGTFTITVNKNDAIRAMGLLSANGQPEKNYASMGEIFKKDSFISSPLEEQARFIYALEEEISNMVSQIDGVIAVKTQVSLPPPVDNLWQADPVKPTAAVFIKYDNSYRLDLYINKIKQLVANSVPGLTQDRVAVLSMSKK